MIGTADGKTNQSGNESNLGKSSHEASKALNSILSSPRLKRLALREPDLAARKREVADIERVRDILGLEEDQIDLVVEAARSGNEAADADEAKIFALQAEVLALRRVMSKVEASRKAAEIRKFFDDGTFRNSLSLNSTHYSADIILLLHPSQLGLESLQHLGALDLHGLLEHPRMEVLDVLFQLSYELFSFV